MAIEVKWSLEAAKTYDQNIRYLLKEWSEKEVVKFLKQTDYVLSRLQEYPESFNPSLRNKKVRRARLNKYNNYTITVLLVIKSLCYRFGTQGKTRVGQVIEINTAIK
jgi:hypothetical protein